jgi:hypothetical protein
MFGVILPGEPGSLPFNFRSYNPQNEYSLIVWHGTPKAILVQCSGQVLERMVYAMAQLKATPESQPFKTRSPLTTMSTPIPVPMTISL